MTESINIQPIQHKIKATIRPPGSKSITNRALIIAAMADGDSVLSGALASDDTHVMIDSLQRLGIFVEPDETSKTIMVQGCGGAIPNPAAELFVDNSGTTIRFLTAMLAIAGGEFRLDGVARMRERPIGPLVEALDSIGISINAESPNQCPPVQINSTRWSGGQIKVRGDISSQYLSGILMAAPLSPNDVEVLIDGELISQPYVNMTIEVMRSFGVNCQSNEDLSRFKIAAGQNYSACEYGIEPDASAASYFWAAAAICGGTAIVEGLNRNALQGDVGFVDCLEQMGCSVDYQSNSIAVTGPAKTGIDIDMGNVSDTVQTLSAVALFVDGTTRVRNIAHNRVKETDRIGNLAIELRKFGATVEEFPDGMAITPGKFCGAEIETYNDHRMAMSLALVGLRQAGVVINNPGCVSKTYPDYFADLKKFCTL